MTNGYYNCIIYTNCIFYTNKGGVTMEFYILRIKIKGIKNIANEIVLDFYKDVVTKSKFDTKKYHVKAIYGPNGAGKTAIMKAMDIYKNIILNEDYITVENVNSDFDNLINKLESIFSIEVVYCVMQNKKITDIYSSYLSLEKNNEKFSIKEEKLCKLKGVSINKQENFKAVYHVLDGEIIEVNGANEEYKDGVIKKATYNLLRKQSLVPTVAFYVAKNTELNRNEQFYVDISINMFFCMSINVLLQDSDENYINFENVSEQIKTITGVKEKVDYKIFLRLLAKNKISKEHIERVSKENYKDYEKWVNDLKSFIQVFKNDLQNIEIKKTENGDYYECELVMVYENNLRINRKYESTGIKKIINMYSALCELNKGNIVFIDEFDANLHDVLLDKIIEYIVDYAKGQLIFTTHNVQLMNILKKNKNSIDFLSASSKVVPWVTNGNYSPINLYKKGLIDQSPFNLEAFNFIGVFGDNINE